MLSRNKIDALWLRAHDIAPQNDAKTFAVFARLVEAVTLEREGRNLPPLLAKAFRERAKKSAAAAKEGR